MERERKPFEIHTANNRYILELGNCAIHLFRYGREYDHLFIDGDNNRPAVRLFGNTELIRWIGGYEIGEDEDGELERRTVVFIPQEDEDGYTFRSVYGWNPRTVEEDEPNEEVIMQYLEVMSEDEDWK